MDDFMDGFKNGLLALLLIFLIIITSGLSWAVIRPTLVDRQFQKTVIDLLNRHGGAIDSNTTDLTEIKKKLAAKDEAAK